MAGAANGGAKEITNLSVRGETTASFVSGQLGGALAAINDANRKAEDQLSKQMGGLMGGLKIPGL